MTDPGTINQDLLDDDWPKQGTWDITDSQDGIVTTVTTLAQLWHSLRPVPPDDEDAKRELLLTLMRNPSWKKAPATLVEEAAAFLAESDPDL